MVKLYDGGAYLINGAEIVADNQDASAVLKSRLGDCVPEKAEAARNTIAYGILKEHNTSGSMDKLKIKFDKLTSHDITFVGIIQTARASGLEKFPVPYVLTNCHNSLCAVGGTINEDDHMFGLTCAKKYGGVYVPPHQGDAGRRRTDDFRLGFPYPLRGSGNYGYGRGWPGAGEAAS